MNRLPAPRSVLDYHRILSPTAGVRVSPLCLGAMNFGDAWKAAVGECNKQTTFEILDHFHQHGGNFIDTANGYQDEQSEQWIGEWMEARGVRDQMIVATKFSSGYRGGTDPTATQSNFSGNSTKSMHVSLEASLKKLRTSYVDILYLHWWDWSTSVPEIMRSLNRLADQGKVLYLGVSDTPAWVVSKANQWARDHGLRQFVVYQGKWNAAERDFEREILPMCDAEGMALAPFGVLGAGYFKTDEQREKEDGRLDVLGPPSEATIGVAKVLQEMAKEKNTLPTSIALAYVMHKTPYVFPTIGGRTVNHLQQNIEALSIRLSGEDMERIENAHPFDHGFPLNFLFRGQKNPSYRASDSWLVKSAVHLDVVDRPRPIEPRSNV